MKKLIVLILIIIFCQSVFAVDKAYKPNWESIDSRPNPQWWNDAKFGIFIHWGLYSVPSWSPKGTYSEWYWYAMDWKKQKPGKQQKRHDAVTKFHKRVYGEDFQYSDFRPGFNCDMFDADEWAKVFDRSGAKYVVLTSKHHDGYCLWPSKEASKSYGIPWNSVESGPKRDLVGELTDAVRKTDVKMGLYYSILEWFNPYFPEKEQYKVKQYAKSEGRKKYMHEVMHPQFKDIVKKYQPSIIFADGDWRMHYSLWETLPLLSWLFNEAPNRDEVVINDRWGKVRQERGGYYTTEYGAGFDDIDKPWEENRGIGMSFGFNREEDYDDYYTEEQLLYTLVEIVSRGGNLLLDIGPTADGRIPIIMEERLVQMGNWLNVNGEAIYGTTGWRRSCQWTEGEIPEFTKEEHHHGFPLFEMTKSPKQGNARKEYWFTYKDDNLYVLTPGWPRNEKFLVKDVPLSKSSEIEFLGCDKDIKWKKRKGGVEIDVSNLTINDLPSNYIHTFKISNVIKD